MPAERRSRWRWAALALALVVCAWFALGVRQATSLTHAEAIIYAQPYTTAARARVAEALLDEAGWLNPDRQVEIDRAHILLERHDPKAALPIAESVVGAEPQNIQAWLWLAHSEETDPAMVLHAIRRAQALDPLAR
jgi:predicted Zn-dependent protease